MSNDQDHKHTLDTDTDVSTNSRGSESSCYGGNPWARSSI